MITYPPIVPKADVTEIQIAPPVSYTHLDVYKRQALELYQRISRFFPDMVTFPQKDCITISEGVYLKTDL